LWGKGMDVLPLPAKAIPNIALNLYGVLNAYPIY